MIEAHLHIHIHIYIYIYMIGTFGLCASGFVLLLFRFVSFLYCFDFPDIFCCRSFYLCVVLLLNWIAFYFILLFIFGLYFGTFVVAFTIFSRFYGVLFPILAGCLYILFWFSLCFLVQVSVLFVASRRWQRNKALRVSPGGNQVDGLPPASSFPFPCKIPEFVFDIKKSSWRSRL